MTDAALKVQGLNVAFSGRQGPVRALRNISFSAEGERVGIVGESGSGKSTVAKAILGILPGNASVSATALKFGPIDLLSVSAKEWQSLRGRRLSLIPQDPRHALNPLIPVGNQIAETLLFHKIVPASQADEAVHAALDEVGIDNPKRVAGLYPHEISGGMGQRAMIAMMLAAKPEFVIADEPTSALDLSVGTRILDLLDDLVVSRGLGLLFISHDLNLVGSFCDRVIVMSKGEIVDEQAAADLTNSTHPYTQRLLGAVPRLNETRRRLTEADL